MSYDPGRIEATYAKSLAEIEDVFDRWGVKEWQVRPLREPDKRDHSWGKEKALVTVEYVQRGQSVHLEMGKHPYYYQNIRVLYYALKSLRENEMRGLTDVVQSAYMQLSAPKQKRDPYEVLGVRPDMPLDVIDAVYRTLAKSRHPDTGGGSTEAMQELNDAYAEIKAQREVRDAS